MKLYPMIARIAVCAAVSILVSCGSQETNGTAEKDTAFDLAVAQTSDFETGEHDIASLRIAGSGENVRVTFRGKPFQFEKLKETRENEKGHYFRWEIAADKGVNFGVAEKYLLAFQALAINNTRLATRPDVAAGDYVPGFGIDYYSIWLTPKQMEKLWELYPDWKGQGAQTQISGNPKTGISLLEADDVLPQPPSVLSLKSVYNPDSARSSGPGMETIFSIAVTGPGELLFDGTKMDFPALKNWIKVQSLVRWPVFSFCLMPETDWETFIQLIDTMKLLSVPKYEITTKFKTE